MSRCADEGMQLDGPHSVAKSVAKTKHAHLVQKQSIDSLGVWELMLCFCTKQACLVFATDLAPL